MVKDWNIKYSVAVVFLLGAGALWSTGGVLIKWISLNALAIAGMRSAISAVVLTIFLRKPRFNWSFEQVGGAVAFAVTVILFVSATKLTTAANAILLQYTAPIYTALFGSKFLGERSSFNDWITIVVVIAGMGLFFFDNLSLKGYLGNGLALLSGVTTACLVLFMRKQKDGSPLESIILGNILTAFAGFPFMRISDLSFYSFLGLIFLGIFQLGFSFILYSIAIRKVKALDAILIATLEPVLNPVWVFIFLKEAPGRWAFVGGGLVIAAVTVRSVYVSLQSKITLND